MFDYLISVVTLEKLSKDRTASDFDLRTSLIELFDVPVLTYSKCVGIA